QEADLQSMTTPITKQNYQGKNVQDSTEVIHEAFHIANTGRKGPVVIDFPKDMGVLSTNAQVTNELELPGYTIPNKPKKDDIQKLRDFLKSAKKPLVLSGAGINHAKANDLFTEFVSRHQLPVVSTYLSLGTIPYENPQLLGMGGV
ncbi:acetolactate synthase large subunit, partial [Staphylococcus cohnii]